MTAKCVLSVCVGAALFAAGTASLAQTASTIEVRLKKASNINDDAINAALKKIQMTSGPLGTGAAELCLKNYEEFDAALAVQHQEEEAAAQALLAAKDATVKQKIAALSKLVGLRSGRFADVPQFITRYEDCLPEKEVAKIAKEYRGYLKQWIALDPADSVPAFLLGNAFIVDGKANDAAPLFSNFLDPKIDKNVRRAALLGMMQVAILKNSIADARKYAQEIADLKLNDARGTLVTGLARAYLMLTDGTRHVDDQKFPYDTGAKPFPTPQQARYTDDFAPLKTIKLELGGGVQETDACIELLKVKLTRFGIAFDKNGAYTLAINTGKTNAPAEEQGYTLETAKNQALIQGADKLGTLWGIVSFIQMIDQKKNAVRVASVHDWPACKNRQVLYHWTPATLEFMLFCKVDGVSQMHTPLSYSFLPAMRAMLGADAKRYAEFGLNSYYGIHGFTMNAKVALSDPRTMKMHEDVCSVFAANGGHVYFPYDDCRYPLNVHDIRAFTIGANGDAKYISQLYKNIKAQYPGFKMVYCPPFYWGPDGAVSYSEDREDYLRSLGKDLDPEITVYWTGPRVKGTTKSPAQVKWYSDLIGRKPVIFQNGTGSHHGFLDFLTDVKTCWVDWHYDGFVDRDIAGFGLKPGTGHSTCGAQGATMGDWTWNPKAYDPLTSIQNVVNQYHGKGMYEAIHPGCVALAVLDKYGWEVTPETVMNLPELEKALPIAEDAWIKAMAVNSFALSNMPSYYQTALGILRRQVANSKKTPDFYKRFAKDIEATKAFAVKETGLTDKDLFFHPVSISGGTRFNYDNKCPRRFGIITRGKNSAIPRLTIKFTCDPFPPEKAYELFIAAQDDDNGRPSKFRILLNNTEIFNGDSPFPEYNWGLHKFPVPYDAFQRNNTLTIESLEEGIAANGPPWLIVNYIVLKP